MNVCEVARASLGSESSIEWEWRRNTSEVTTLSRGTRGHIHLSGGVCPIGGRISSCCSWDKYITFLRFWSLSWSSNGLVPSKCFALEEAFSEIEDRSLCRNVSIFEFSFPRPAALLVGVQISQPSALFGLNTALFGYRQREIWTWPEAFS